MSNANTTLVRIDQQQSSSRLSPAQKKFNATIKKIETQKHLLAAWQETLPQCRQTISEKLEPLRTAYAEQQVAMALLLDQLATTERFTHKQQDKIAYLISELCEDLISQHGREDLKPLYNHYSGGDFDEELEEETALQTEMMKSMLEETLGVSIDEGDIDLEDPEKTFERLQEKFNAQQEAATEKRNKRKKTAKQQAKEAREQEEQANISKSIQAVYRQLVTALHPDRETDPAEQVRKTGLMQQVTVAYKKKDLLQLLELQLAVEQIDQNNIDALSEDRLKYYNKILAGQLQELKDEISLLETGLKQMAGLAPHEPISPPRLIRLLSTDIKHLKDELSRLKKDLRIFREVKSFKVWLKHYEIPEPDLDDLFDFPFR